MDFGRLCAVGAIAGLLAAAGASGVPVSSLAETAAPPAARASVQHAYTFLDQMMDRYATGTTPRLVQSFTGGVLGRQHFADSEAR